jgi:hypothetical protein
VALRLMIDPHERGADPTEAALATA